MASRSLNRVIIIGNLTRDPELKYTPNGTAVCTFGVATNRTWTTADGQQKEDVQYHRIVAWQKLAELCGKLLNKGKKVFLEGRLTYRTFVGRDGQERNITEIVLDDFIVFSDGKRVSPTETPEKREEEKPTTENTTSIEELTSSKESTKLEKKGKKTEEKAAQEKEEDNETVNPEDIPF